MNIIENSAYVAAIEAEKYSFIPTLTRYSGLNMDQAKSLCSKYRNIPMNIRDYLMNNTQSKKKKINSARIKLLKNNNKCYKKLKLHIKHENEVIVLTIVETKD